MKKKIYYWLPPVIWAALIFALSSIPSLKVEALGAWDYFFRKIWHLTEYAVLAVLFVRLGRYQGQDSRTVYVVSVIGAIIYALTDEWHQTLVAGRVGSPIDIGIDSLGALAGTVLAARFKLMDSRIK